MNLNKSYNDDFTPTFNVTMSQCCNMLTTNRLQGDININTTFTTVTCPVTMVNMMLLLVSPCNAVAVNLLHGIVML